MSFLGEHGISCDECGYQTTNPEYTWNTLAAEDGENYYLCSLECLGNWAYEYASEDVES